MKEWVWIWDRPPHQGLCPYSLQTELGSSMSHRIDYMCKGCETGLTVPCPYLGRLESLTICNAFSSVIFETWSVGLAGVWTYIQPPAYRPCAYSIELTVLQLLSFSFITCFILLLFQMVWEQGVVVIVNLTKLSDLGLVSAALHHF